MNNIKSINALGVVSFTSMEGIEVASIKTDGVDIFDFGASYIVPFDEDLAAAIQKADRLKPDSPKDAVNIRRAEITLTEYCASLVKSYIEDSKQKYDIIGFSGHTIFHDPQNHYTNQIGDGKMLSELTGIKTVSKFRRADILAGGTGAPFTPVFYNALTGDMPRPLAVVDIGAVSGITWLGEFGEMLGFISGPGNAVINDWTMHKAGLHMDYNGKLAITGHIDNQILATLIKHKYLGQTPPKAADKKIFDNKMQHLDGLGLEDGAATATAFVAESIAMAITNYLPYPPLEIILCGGGAKNPTLVRFLRQRLSAYMVKTAADIGWKLDGLDAEASAFWAVRRLYHLPVSFPSTTGVPEPTIGGELFEP